MGKHLVTIEVDTDRSVYGTDWEADHDTPAHLDEEVPAFAETLGGEPGAQWDHPPFSRVVSVRPAGEVRQRVDALAEDCGYDPEGEEDSGVDALIGYKDGLESLLFELAAEPKVDEAGAMNTTDGLGR